MPPPLMWTPQRDEMLRQLRDSGATWDRIARVFGVSRWSVLERGKALGEWRPVAPAAIPEPKEHANRPPFEPGHPVTWGAITAGTCLAGTPYVYQPPSGLSRKERQKINEIFRVAA